jgi:hypothetical protein
MVELTQEYVDNLFKEAHKARAKANDAISEAAKARALSILDRGIRKTSAQDSLDRSVGMGHEARTGVCKTQGRC